mgnify:FL=1
MVHEPTVPEEGTESTIEVVEVEVLVAWRAGVGHSTTVVAELIVVVQWGVPGAVDQFFVVLRKMAQTASEHLSLGRGEVTSLGGELTQRSADLHP